MRTQSLLFAPTLLAALSSPLFAQGVPPVAGEIAVTEILFNPGADACVKDEGGEYFEVTNISNKVLNLNGLYVSDTVSGGGPTVTYFRILPSVATLPPMNPGHRFIFCRSANPALNGGITNVAYAYCADDGVAPAELAPADKSQVGTGGMNLGNSDSDGVQIWNDVPPFAGGPGTLITAAYYNLNQAPLAGATSGLAYERIDLNAPFGSVVGVNATNSNGAQALSSATFGTCAQHGTPGSTNSVDATGLWPGYEIFDSVSFPNTSTLTPVRGVSVGEGARFLYGNLPLAGFGYWLLFAADVATEFPIGIFLPGNPGSYLVDFASLGFVGPFPLDGSGTADQTFMGINAALVGMTFRFQAQSLDSSFVIVLSNGVRAYITE